MIETETPTPAVDSTPHLTSPYPGAKYQADGCMRITIDVPQKDVQTIRLVNLSRGFLYLSLQNFIKLLANECERNNWNINNADDLERFVLAKCGHADAGVGDRPNEDVGRGARGLRQDGQGTANKRAVGQRKQTSPADSGKQIAE